MTDSEKVDGMKSKTLFERKCSVWESLITCMIGWVVGSGTDNKIKIDVPISAMFQETARLKVKEEILDEL